MNRSSLTPPGAPPPPLKKVKLFIYGAILLKFETQHLHMFINNKLYQNLEFRKVIVLSAA